VLRRALFLGAGASRPLGLPTTAEILPAILHRLEAGGLFGHEPRREGRDDAAALRDGLKHLAPGLLRRRAEPPLITDLLSLLDQLLTDGHSLAPDFGRASLERLRTLLVRAMGEVLEQPQARDGEAADVPAGAPDLLERFAAWVRDTSRGDGGLDVVSTNYDLLFESKLYPLLGEENVPERVDLGIAWRDPAGRRHPRPAAPWLGFFKLHGSLDWLRCPLCEHVTLDLGRSLARAQASAAVAVCACGGPELTHLIVAPSVVREIRDTNLLALWQAALEALREAAEWIFIGYSMPPEDVAIRSLLLRAHRGRREPPVIRVIESGHQPEVEGRYRLLFPNLRFDTGGVEAFVLELGGEVNPPGAPSR
jgi:hypothetical protein